MKSAEIVKDRIRSAFAMMPVPVSIIDTGIGDSDSRRMFRDNFQGKRWGEIQADTLCLHHDTLFFLSSSGFHYLIPAFMIAALDSPESHLVEAVVFALTRPSDPQDEQLFIETMSLFDGEQRSAIRAFLEYLKDEEPQNWPDNAPMDALNKYWLD